MSPLAEKVTAPRRLSRSLLLGSQLRTGMESLKAPYGAWSPYVLERCAQARMTPLGWSVDPRDWSRPGVAAIVANIMGNTRTGSIILEHDGGGNRAQTVAALKIVIPRLLAAGYHFRTP
jgi:peptidoglycan/xylan/chitin deacetylase (PgdA/CDA1 family)